MTPASFDAVVAGGGPAGSATAILLARAGWSVALLEKQRFPRRKVCGECVAASNLPLLDVLGVGETLRENGGPPIRTIGLMHRKRTVVAAMPAGPDREAAWGRAFGREALDTLLLEQARASGVSVLQPWSVDDIAGMPGNWHCHARHTETGVAMVVDAEVMVRCARVMGIPALHPSYRERAPAARPTAGLQGKFHRQRPARWNPADSRIPRWLRRHGQGGRRHDHAGVLHAP